MDESDAFKATGQSSAGFFTYSNSIDVGVYVQGKISGVCGESILNIPHDRYDFSPNTGTGVFGAGDRYGVFGASSKIVAQEKPTLAVPAGLKDGIGVVGSSLERPGVVGMSGGIQAAELNSLHNQALDPTEAPMGVVGIGKGGDASGVYGAGFAGRGGIFQSDGQAQLNLKPIDLKAGQIGLPSNGMTGDLLVVTHNHNTGDEFSELWFCDRGMRPGHGAHWSRVAFDRFVQTP